MADVTSEIRGGAGIIFFNNPDGGFLTSDMVEMASEKFDALRVDENVRSIIFTGTLDEVFIRHFSVEEIIAMASALRENNKTGVTPERFALSPLRAFWETHAYIKKAGGPNTYIAAATPQIAGCNGQGRGERQLLEQPGRLVRKHRPDLLMVLVQHTTTKWSGPSGRGVARRGYNAHKVTRLQLRRVGGSATIEEVNRDDTDDGLAPRLRSH